MSDLDLAALERRAANTNMALEFGPEEVLALIQRLREAEARFDSQRMALETARQERVMAEAEADAAKAHVALLERVREAAQAVNAMYSPGSAAASRPVERLRAALAAMEDRAHAKS